MKNCEFNSSRVHKRKVVYTRWIDAAADMALMLTAVRQMELLKKRTMEIKTIQKAVAEAPEVREGLVQKIAGVIATGSYFVTGADVVPRMIREHMMDPLR